MNVVTTAEDPSPSTTAPSGESRSQSTGNTKFHNAVTRKSTNSQYFLKLSPLPIFNSASVPCKLWPGQLMQENLWPLVPLRHNSCPVLPPERLTPTQGSVTSQGAWQLGIKCRLLNHYLGTFLSLQVRHTPEQHGRTPLPTHSTTSLARES